MLKTVRKPSSRENTGILSFFFLWGFTGSSFLKALYYRSILALVTKGLAPQVLITVRGPQHFAELGCTSSPMFNWHMSSSFFPYILPYSLSMVGHFLFPPCHGSQTREIALVSQHWNLFYSLCLLGLMLLLSSVRLLSIVSIYWENYIVFKKQGKQCEFWAGKPF